MKKLILTLLMTSALAAPSNYATAQQMVWTGSWAAAPVAVPAMAENADPNGTTYRDVVHLSVGGKAVRRRISNEFGPTPLTVASVHVALSAGADATQPGTDHVVTFGGIGSVTLPGGAVVLSDPVAMSARPFANLAVSLFVPAQTGVTLTYHQLAVSTNYVA